MTACTEFFASRRIQRTAAYKVPGQSARKSPTAGVGRFATVAERPEAITRLRGQAPLGGVASLGLPLVDEMIH